jgi:hypothetical protein
MPNKTKWQNELHKLIGKPSTVANDGGRVILTYNTAKFKGAKKGDVDKLIKRRGARDKNMIYLPKTIKLHGILGKV